MSEEADRCIDSAFVGRITPTAAFAELIKYFIYTM